MRSHGQHMNSMNGPCTKTIQAKSIIQKDNKGYQSDKLHLKPRLTKVIKETLKNIAIQLIDIDIMVADSIKAASNVGGKLDDEIIYMRR